MNVYEFVLLIVLIVTIGKLVERKMKHRGAHSMHLDEDNYEADPVDAEKIRTLEERIEVLERIVTDQGYETRQRFREIE